MSKLGLAVALVLSFVPLSRGASGDEGWNMLKSLAGNWHGPGEGGKDVQISYQVISNGNTVMETMKAEDGSPFMVTMYHHDGDSLVATHYCALGNQPRMRAKSADGKQIVFKFVDVTNLASPDAAHIHDLTLTFLDADHLTQEWTHRAKGKDGMAVFKLTRVK